ASRSSSHFFFHAAATPAIFPLSLHDALPISLIAAPAVFTNASSLLVLGTSNRLARVVDRTRYIARELHISARRDEVTNLWINHRSEEHTSELQSLTNLVCRLLL